MTVCVRRSWKCPEESELFLRLAWTRLGVGAERGDNGMEWARGAAMTAFACFMGRQETVLDEVSAHGSGVEVRRKLPEAGVGHIVEWWALRATASRPGRTAGVRVQEWWRLRGVVGVAC